MVLLPTQTFLSLFLTEDLSRELMGPSDLQSPYIFLHSHCLLEDFGGSCGTEWLMVRRGKAHEGESTQCLRKVPNG